MIRAAGGEIGLHGGYYRFKPGGGYRESREILQAGLGGEIVGIRNHFRGFPARKPGRRSNRRFPVRCHLRPRDRSAPARGACFRISPPIRRPAASWTSSNCR
jgi:hypothetical protein